MPPKKKVRHAPFVVSSPITSFFASTSPAVPTSAADAAHDNVCIPKSPSVSITSTSKSNPQKEEQIYQKDKYHRSFSSKWLSTYPWLIWDDSLQAVLCKSCSLVYKHGVTSTSKAESAFSCTGFRSWKKVPLAYKNHELSGAHKVAIYKANCILKGENVAAKLTQVHSKERQDNTEHLSTIFRTLKYLGRQAIAIRGSDDASSNFEQLLQLQCATNNSLQSWLQRKTSWTSHDIQNKMLEQMAAFIQRDLAAVIQNSTFFGLMADETTDVAGVEQMSVGFRIVTKELEVIIKNCLLQYA